MAPWGPPKCHLPPSLRCGDSCRHFVCCSSCSCRRCCCCCHCELWWAWSRLAGGRVGRLCLGLSKVFVRYWKIEMLPHVLGNFLYLLIFGLECWPTTKLPSCLLFFNFALFCVPPPPPLFPFCMELKFQWVSGFLSHSHSLPSHSSPAPSREYFLF